jgi:phospholipid N-methyltransferase
MPPNEPINEKALFRRHPALKTPDTVAFFKGFLDHPERVGSVVPSSRFLEQRIVDTAGIRSSRLVVELGPGTGGTTRAMLRALPSSGKLLTIEISADFSARLDAIDDPRLINHVGSAADISQILAELGLGQPDAVVSGIPFSTIPVAVGKEIIRSVWSALAHGGCFVAYQFRSQVARLGRELIGNPDVSMELRNAPPMRFYRWRKPLNDHSSARS